MGQNINELLDQLNVAKAQYTEHMIGVDSFIQHIDNIHPQDDQLVRNFISGLPDHQEKAFYLLQKIGQIKLKLLSAVVANT